MASGRRYPRGWYAFRKYILERDGYRCRECGKPGKLEVSHIISVKERADLGTGGNECKGIVPLGVTSTPTVNQCRRKLLHGKHWWAN